MRITAAEKVLLVVSMAAAPLKDRLYLVANMRTAIILQFGITISSSIMYSAFNTISQRKLKRKQLRKISILQKP